MRRWRSVTFRSGLTAAVVVGLIASMLLLVLVFAVYFFVVVGTLEFSVIQEAERQLLSGTEPGELNLPTAGGIDETNPAGADGSTEFWAVLRNGDVLQSSGEVNQAVIGQGLAELNVTVTREDQDEIIGTGGVKNVDGVEWFYQEHQVQTSDGANYLVVAAVQGTFSFGRFLRSSLIWVVPVVLILATVAGLLTSYMTRRALRRVENIRAEVDMISQRSLHRRVPIVDAADGINRLAITMNDMLQRLQTSSNQQNQFLADASHELRSPVAGMLAQLEVAASYPDRVDTTTLLPKLHDEAQRLQGLVNDLLFLSRSESGGSATVPAPVMVSVNDLLTDELEHHQLLGHKVQPSIGRSCDASVVGSKADLQRAVRNLVNNAVRHSETAVTIDADRVGGQVVISVSDDGPGIDPADADRIFDRFVRLDEARSRDEGGAGLGLAIAQEVAQRHGGRIILAETRSSGATFQLSLPVSS